MWGIVLGMAVLLLALVASVLFVWLHMAIFIESLRWRPWESVGSVIVGGVLLLAWAGGVSLVMG